MRRRYVLAPEAALDLVQIWRHIKKKASLEITDRVESAIRGKVAFLAASPGAGHWRPDLTIERVRFFLVYSYLIVYRPETKPLQVVAILHGHREAASQGSLINAPEGRHPGRARFLISAVPAGRVFWISWPRAGSNSTR